MQGGCISVIKVHSLEGIEVHNLKNYVRKIQVLLSQLQFLNFLGALLVQTFGIKYS